MVALSKLVGKQDGEVEDPSRGWHSMSRGAHGYAIINVQNGENFECREAMEGRYEYKTRNEVEVKARSKVLRGGPRAGVGGGHASLTAHGKKVVGSPQQWVNEQKDGEVWYVVSETGILTV